MVEEKGYTYISFRESDFNHLVELANLLVI